MPLATLRCPATLGKRIMGGHARTLYQANRHVYTQAPALAIPPCIHQGDTHCAHLLLTAATTGGWRRSILAAHKYWLRVRSWLRTSLAARSTGAKCWLLAISDARSLAQRMWAARSFGRPASLWACLPTDDEPLTSLLAPPWQTVAHPRVTVVPLSVLGQA